MRARGDVNGIPEVVPLFYGASANTIIFPSSAIRLRLRKADMGSVDIQKSPFIVVCPVTSKGQHFPIGVLCEVRVVFDSGEIILVYFEGITRVVYALESSSPEDAVVVARWTVVHDTFADAEEKASDPYKDRVGLCSFAFINFINEFSLLDKETATRVMGYAFSKEALLQVSMLREETLPQALDMIANVLCMLGANYMNEIIPEAEPEKKYLRDFMLTIMSEYHVPLRYLCVMGMMGLLLSVVSRVQKKDNSTISPPSIIDRIRAGPKKPVIPLLSPPKDFVDDMRSLTREELAKPRTIPKGSLSPAPPPANAEFIILDVDAPDEYTQQVIDFFDYYLVDQDRCKKHFARILASVRMNMILPKKPIMGGILCGPTGVGKTEIVKLLAQFLMGDPEGYVHISGETLKQEHTASKLIGAPAGYVGYSEMTAFSQWALDRPHFLKLLREKHAHEPAVLEAIMKEIPALHATMNQGWRGDEEKKNQAKQRLYELGWQPGRHLAIVLLDEIEKAHPDVMRLFIRVCDDGQLHLMNNEITIFTNTILVFTSNIFGRDIQRMISGRGKIGFSSPQNSGQLSQDIWKGTVGAIEKFLLPELFGRIGKENIVVFHPLKTSEIAEVLERIEFPNLAESIRNEHGIQLHISELAKRLIVEEATDKTNSALGVRALSAVLQNKIKSKLAIMIAKGASGGLVRGDGVLIDVLDSKIVFKKIII